MHKISILYSWFIRSFFFFFPNIPIVMRLRGWLYSFMMKECGKNFQVAADVYFNNLTGLIAGDNVYIAPRNTIIAKELFIGHNVIIGPGCVISGGNHQFDGVSFRNLPSSIDKVIINEGCWIAANCTIVCGSVLPKNSILGAGAVLNKKFSDEKAIYGGLPAKFIKYHD